MVYDILKIVHILGATLLLTSFFYSCWLWLSIRRAESSCNSLERIQRQAWTLFIPFALFQLATGFTMISVKQYDLSEFWIMGSIGGFMVLISSWFTFLYLLLSTDKTTNHSSLNKKIQAMMLIISTVTVLFIIFLMVNKIT